MTRYDPIVPSVATDTSITPISSRWRSDFVYDGLGRLRVRREYTWTSSGGGETEISKSLMTASASSTTANWVPANAIDGLTTDPGWHNNNNTGTNEFLRIDLGGEHNVSHVAYIPRQMTANGPADGSWNGVFKQYEIYVTDDSSDTIANWGAPVATGTWTWPNLQERKDVTFTPKTGRYVCFRRVTAYGLGSDQGNPGYACANEIWAYESTAGGGGETEISKGIMSSSASSTTANWVPANAIDGPATDPGWHNNSNTGTNEFLRIDLGGEHNVSHVAYIPRQMTANGPADGSWNGVFKQYEIYVTDDSSGTIANWGAPVAAGTWNWPNLQERKVVTFTPKTGRYVCFRRVTAYGWGSDQGNPGYACANEIWIYEQSGGGGSGSWTVAGETRYLYDGKRVVQKRDSSDTPTISYTRGQDLSGSLEGAGGIGGLLARSDGYSGGTWTAHSFYHADGNGNVTCMIDSAPEAAMVANYKYDPYGRTISSSGSLAAANVYRFSSKEIHPNSGMYYYLYRFYDPTTQRWLNRDPLGERGFELVRHARDGESYSGDNLYTFVANDPCDNIDRNGLTLWLCSRKTDYGVANHVYFWNDKPPGGDGPSCGMNASNGRGNPNAPNHPEQGPPRDGHGGDACQPIPETEDAMYANAVWDCCKKSANTGGYKPWGNDCHDKLNDCLTPFGITPPKHPRFGHPRVLPSSGRPPIFSQLSN